MSRSECVGRRLLLGQRVSLMLGVVSLVAVGVSHLALTDIAHGEPDLTQEWNVVRAAVVSIVAFQFAALATLWRLLRAATEP